MRDYLKQVRAFTIHVRFYYTPPFLFLKYDSHQISDFSKYTKSNKLHDQCILLPEPGTLLHVTGLTNKYHATMFANIILYTLVPCCKNSYLVFVD